MDSARLQSCPTTFSCFWDTSRTFSPFPLPHPLSIKQQGSEQFCENFIVTCIASHVSIGNAMGKPNKGKKPSKEPTKKSTKDKDPKGPKSQGKDPQRSSNLADVAASARQASRGRVHDLHVEGEGPPPAVPVGFGHDNLVVVWAWRDRAGQGQEGGRLHYAEGGRSCHQVAIHNAC
jgi:hypothetical protein